MKTTFSNMRRSSVESRPGTEQIRLCGFLVAALAAAPLGACVSQRPVPPVVSPYDYHDRHPVVLSEAPHVIDVFPGSAGGRIDPQTEARLTDFLARYREFGRGQITILTPAGGSGEKVAREANSVRHWLAAAGVGGTATATYPVADPTLAAPIRLSFQSLKAKTANRCGEWPNDLASASSTEGWRNVSYWNFGCASQATLSAQVADPRDLAYPRGQSASDIEMRLRAINRIRRGEDPSTNWRLQGTQISGVGGGS